MTLLLATSCVLACFGGSVKTFGWVMFGARSVQALFIWVLVVLCVGVVVVVVLLLLLLFWGGITGNCILIHLGL